MAAAALTPGRRLECPRTQRAKRDSHQWGEGAAGGSGSLVSATRPGGAGGEITVAIGLGSATLPISA
eukprot:4284656-Alexandrium_andersonii.AAC.1